MISGTWLTFASIKLFKTKSRALLNLGNLSIVNGSRNGITQLTFFIDLLGEEYGIPKVEWPPYVVSLTIGGRKDIVEHDYELLESIVARIGGRNLDVPQFP